jgi:outer membrane protein
MILFCFEPNKHKRTSSDSSNFRTSAAFMPVLAIAAVLPVFFNCAHHMPGVRGVPSTSPSPAVPWTPPPSGNHEPARHGSTPPPEQIAGALNKLTLAEAVDIALKNNPDARAAWANARAAAADFGSARGEWLPELSLNGALTRSKGTLSQSSRSGSGENQPVGPATTTSAAANLSYLLFNFGGRAAMIEESRQALLAADWTHNAVIQNTVLGTEEAFFNYAEANALLEADRTSLSDAEENLKAAEERHRVGLATSADVLQAKTAYSEVKLAVLGVEGQVRIAKGALAVSMGYPANLPHDIRVIVPEPPAGDLSETVDQLIERAMAGRPDLQAARALALESSANARLARSRMLPSLSAAGSAGRYWLKDVPGYSDTYSGSLLLQIPVFGGFSREFDLIRAKAGADAAAERARAVEQAVVFEVYASHSNFLTATQRIQTTNDLLASATQSEQVALGRYKEGVGNILDLLSAQRALAAARAEHINARLGWFITLARLAHDVGILGSRGENPLMPGASLQR